MLLVMSVRVPMTWRENPGFAPRPVKTATLYADRSVFIYLQKVAGSSLGTGLGSATAPWTVYRRISGKSGVAPVC